jgi:2-hydroxychromene-2-carboxylate isomerase
VFPASSLPALTLAAAAYDVDLATGETVSLALRDLLFEQGANIADDDEVLTRLAAAHGLTPNPGEAKQVHDDHAEGVTRGVLGSPHFFTPGGGFFCPSLDIHREADGHLRISSDAAGFENFIAGCFG